MTQQEFRRALDSLTPDAGMKSRIAAGLGQTERRRSPKPLRRAAAGILAAAMVVTGTMAAAMAASPDFRAMVLSFFRLEETEQVPEPGDTTNSPPSVTQGVIGPVKAQYIQLPGLYSGSGLGVLFQMERSPEDGSVQSMRFWAVEDGALVEAETRSTSFSLTWAGVEIQDTVYWCVWDGQTTYYCSRGTLGDEQETSWVVRRIPGRDNLAELILSVNTMVNYREYPMLLHLDTGEIEDVLAGTGVDQLDWTTVEWSDDLSAALVIIHGGETVYYCDVAAKTLTELGELTGTAAKTASISGDGTLLLYDFGDEMVNTWTYDPKTGQAVPVLVEEPLYRAYDEVPSGSLFYDISFCVRVSAEGQTWVVDLRTGEDTPVDNFTYTKGSHFVANPAGTKLLYYVGDESAEGLAISQLGALDLEEGRFIAFDREGYTTLTGGLGWFDNNRAKIWGQPADNTASYLYLYEFS